MHPANPVLVEVVRGGAPESWHRGAIAVAGDNGVEGIGEIEAGVYVRSAVKPFQALPGLRAGMARRFGLVPEDLALIAASHGGEPRHVERAAALLEKGGFSPADLACGVHPPLTKKVALELATAGSQPSVLHNNCSGKHAGMLLACATLGLPISGYADASHPLQRAIRDTLAGLCGLAVEQVGIAVDGCSAPTFRLPLAGIARAFAALAAPERAGDEGLASALLSMRDAMRAHPFLTAGDGRFEAELMEACGGRVVAKIGAEGVIACGILPLRAGIAIKVDDGSDRGYVQPLLELLSRLCVLDDASRASLSKRLDRRLRNHAGLEVGELRPRLPEGFPLAALAAPPPGATAEDRR